jgi:CRP-like cAMP-binding protein
MSSPRNAFLELFSANGTDEDHPRHDVLIKPDAPSKWIYFPHRGTVISLIRSTTDGATVEVGIIGWEGFVNAQTLLLPSASGFEAVVQIPGSLTRVRAADVRALLDKNVTRDALLAFCGTFLAQISQHAVCNRLHSIEQRLAKWLLGVRDRMDSDELELTHDFLSHMLGIRRSGVTVAVGALALDGIVTQQRSSITITDRDGLEARACECYRVIREALPD